MEAEARLRREISKCHRCEACRDLTESSCVFFPAMFELAGLEHESGKKTTTDQLRHLVNLCTFCAVCPCTDIRMAILQAKTGYAEKYGLGFRIRLLENVQRIGKMGCTFPHLTNFLAQSPVCRRLLETTLGIHRRRKIPPFPGTRPTSQLSNRANPVRSGSRGDTRVAYFSGCSARYFFPEIAQSVFEVLERNGIDVYYPEQYCCGVPAWLEGDRKLALKYAEKNTAILSNLIEDGYDIVCSCPTCGYMLRRILRTGADFAIPKRHLESSDGKFVELPIKSHGDRTLKIAIRDAAPLPMVDAYFLGIPSDKRVMVSERTFDVGEFLLMLHRKGELDVSFREVNPDVLYYPPCHLREQGIGMPYHELLTLIPEAKVEAVSGLRCCGNAGIMGFKKEFHAYSLRIASSLVSEVRRSDPELLATDCMSCRIQFNQLTHYEVLHPIQIIRNSY